MRYLELGDIAVGSQSRHEAAAVWEIRASTAWPSGVILMKGGAVIGVGLSYREPARPIGPSIETPAIVVVVAARVTVGSRGDGRID